MKSQFFPGLAVLALLLAGCSDGSINSNPADGLDGEVDGGQDAGDPGSDMAGDASDAGSDPGADPGSDLGADLGADEGLLDGGDSAQTCQYSLIETLGSTSIIAAPAGGLPAKGDIFVIPETGIEVRRISDSSDSDGFSSFYTNGYSRWSPANITGEYVTAFASNGGAAFYRMSDLAVVHTVGVGESNELHWDFSGQPGTATSLYYRSGTQLRQLDILSGDDGLVHDFINEYPGAGQVLNGVEGAPSNDMRYWAFQVCTGMTGGGQCTGILDVIVYDKTDDLIVGRLKDKYASIPTPNFVDMSPSGERIVVGSCAGNSVPFNGPYAWSRDFETYVRLNTNCSHSGWAWGAVGEEFYVNFDTCGENNDEITFSCDYTTAVDVNRADGWENRIPIIYQGDIGWGNHTHMGRVYDPAVRGWFFMSTYSSGDLNWAKDQLFFVEIKDHTQNPRIYRVTPTLNSYEGYWSEAFASLDFQALRVYWGANWSGQGNLELYEARLCDGWWND
ncbi:MAG: hypothetical protein JRJ87_00355 [Deltaproteobacteria bacterium]|nr:hypothetical protein [Deltaproteobacteria bacterium]